MIDPANPASKFGEAAVGAASQTACLVAAAVSDVVHWTYFAPAALVVALAALSAAIFKPYRKWRRAWLSSLVADAMREMRRERARSRRRAIRLSGPAMWNAAYNRVFQLISLAADYLLIRAPQKLRDNYIPSFTSFLLVLVVLILVAVLPHPPSITMKMENLLDIWHYLKTDLDDKTTVPQMLGGLIAIIIALIVFVAESIRSSKHADEKRVLLRISRLWILTLIITLMPIAAILFHPTELTLIVTIGIALMTIWAFGSVLQNLLNVEAGSANQQAFLRSRVRATVLSSARERVGNKILSDKLGPGKEVGLGFTLGKTWLPNKSNAYEFIEAPRDGILSDINLNELKKLGEFLRQARGSQMLGLRAGREGQTVAQPTRPTEDGDDAYLIRRFQEDVPEDTIFSPGKSILAIPKSLASADPSVFAEANSRVAHIFRFSSGEAPSVAFRNEMQSTKDRLIAAIRSYSLGEINELTDSYTLVAEEFLTTINDLGGSYTAEQARSERSSMFTSGWSEVRWLVGDVRDFIIAASDADSANVIGKIIYLPYRIATRSLQAGDHLLFQEFLAFASFIYFLGISKPADSEAGKLMIERSLRYLKELSSYYVQPLLAREDG